jgi:5,6-dimethylbenzimidazole synthase
MQPWNCLLITSPHLRAQIKVLFEEINEGAAHRVVDQTCKRKQLYRSLKLEARIPDEHRRYLGPATGKPFVLGRTPVPDTGIYSTCLAIQNMRYGFVLAMLLDWSVALFAFLKYPAKPSMSR